MAIVQISKIQLRRGQKNSQSGIPQLSSAEMAWAVDTQELFIGNGSVAEGAPYVGNSKILTEHDNLLDFISSYVFANDDPSIFESVSRSLQSKLDETVSVLDFGAIRDGSTDCTVAFQKALDQLYQNTDTNYRKILFVPNGRYLIDSQNLDIPSGTIIKGETRDNAIIDLNTKRIRFKTTDNQFYQNFTSSNFPSDIIIENLTIERTTGLLDFSGVQNSLVKDVTIRGNFVSGTLDSTLQLDSTDYALFWLNDRIGARVNNLKFLNCDFISNSLSFRITQTDAFESRVFLDACRFYRNNTAILIVGVQNQVNSWQIRNTEFEEIYLESFRSTAGIGTEIMDCRFINSGNAGQTAASPQTPMVNFGQSQNNIVINSWTDRQQLAGVVDVTTKFYVTEVENSSRSILSNRNHSTIVGTDSPRPLAIFSAFNRYHIIDYTLQLGEYYRIGQLTISLGTDLAGADNTSRPSITDSFQYSPSLTNSPGGPAMLNFQFFIDLVDNDNDSGVETLILSYRNPQPALTGNIDFSVVYGV
jgi:hypothetical protein